MASFNLKLDKLMLTEYAAEVMVYFERHKLLEIVTRLAGEMVLVRPDDPEFWIAMNIERIASEVYFACLRQNAGIKDGKFFLLPGRFLYRVTMFGRPGCGRKTQALALVKRFNLVYLDVERLIYQNLTATTDAAKELQNAFSGNDMRAKSKAVGKVISRRLLQMDTLHQGWVLVNYPNNVFEMQEVFERFKIPPNKFVYLQCPESICKRRLAAKPTVGKPQDTCMYMSQMINYFNDNEKEADEYLAHRHETIYVDASRCFESVKISVMSQLERMPYILGHKY